MGALTNKWVPTGWRCRCSGWFDYSDYYVTDDNRVWSTGLGQWLTVGRDRLGYLSVSLRHLGVTRRWTIAQLVLGVTQGPPPFEGACCLHKDDNKKNNQPENLYWGTRADNVRDTLRNRGRYSGAKLTNEQAAEIYRAYHSGERTVDELVQKYPIKEGAVYALIYGRTWKHVTREVTLTRS